MSLGICPLQLYPPFFFPGFYLNAEMSAKSNLYTPLNSKIVIENIVYASNDQALDLGCRLTTRVKVA